MHTPAAGMKEDTMLHCNDKYNRIQAPARQIQVVPIKFAEACEFIRKHHRHHQPPVSWKFGMAIANNDKIVGVATIGRPVARGLDNGFTLEVTRCCSDGTTKNVCSMLYAAAWRAARALGYKRLVTYTLISESGVSLKASGYKLLYETKGGSWDCHSRPRIDKAPICQKKLWERQIQ